MHVLTFDHIHLIVVFFYNFVFDLEQEKNLFKAQLIAVNTELKLNVHRTFKRQPGRLLNVLRKFKLRFVSRTTLLCFLWQVLDDYTLAIQSAIEAMASICKEITLREKDKYWKEDSSGELAPPQEIGNSLCPNECSGNGVCSNGTCLCNQDFITADCSLKKGRH